MGRLLGTFGATLAAALAVCVPAWATFPGENGRIAFVSNVTGDAEIYSIEPDGSDRINLTNDPGADEDPAWSPDGTKIAFASDRSGRHEIYVMDVDGSDLQQLTTTTPADDDSREPAWSPDGRIVYVRILDLDPTPPLGNCDSQLRIMSAAGAEQDILTPGPQPCRRDPEWSPDGRWIGYDGPRIGLRVVHPDGTGGVQMQSAFQEAHWSPSSVWVAPDAAPDFSPGRFPFQGTNGSTWRAWSPDGSLAVEWCGRPCSFPDLLVSNELGGERQFITNDPALDYDADWQPLPPAPAQPGHPRPKSASPLSVSLVPAYVGCDAPTKEHGPPLAFGSCPPAQASDYLTVGTGDANGHLVQSVGSVRLGVRVGDPSTTADEADVAVKFRMTDVRCRVSLPTCEAGALSDYTGELEIALGSRITDGFNSGLGTQSATARDHGGYETTARFIASCTATAGAVGGLCELDTTADALVPGQIREGSRAVRAFEQVQVYDGGADGDAFTNDYTLFAVQGLFVP